MIAIRIFNKVFIFPKPQKDIVNGLRVELKRSPSKELEPESMTDIKKGQQSYDCRFLRKYGIKNILWKL